MARLYWFVLASASVKPEASLTSFIAALRKLGAELVDYSEETRRVLHRVPFSKLADAKSLWDRYASTVTLEFKASGKAPEARLSLLRRLFDQADETPAAKLILAACNIDERYAVFAELRKGRFLAKLCRREALNTPVTQLPPSLCAWVYPGVEPEELTKPAIGCITSIYSKLLEAARTKPSA